jgi:stage V sporulation protein R
MERVQDIPQAKNPICSDENWDRDMGVVQAFDELFTAIGSRFNLDIYPNQYKICSSKAMMDAYAHIGMPVMYRHWSFGKKYIQTENAYAGGQMGLAYEIVINSNPCISVNMIDNTTAMTALVMAHAAQGHNSFFKGNYMFRDWTDAEGIMPYLRFAKGYIERCYEQIGEAPVRQFLSSCHALQNMGVDRYKRRKGTASFQSEAERLQAMEKAFQENFNPIFDENAEAQRAAKAIIARNKKRLNASIDYSSGGEENLLYVLEKESIAAKQSDRVQGSPWMVEVMRIVRQIAQYFYPQKQTQVMNEGWASFWHHALTTVAYEKGYLTSNQYALILESHTGVIAQPDYNSPYYSGLNPYKLGFEMYRDIMFMARGPKDTVERKRYEDCRYEENFANKLYYKDGKQFSFLNTDWLDLMHYAMRNFRDESFIREFLSAGICRDFKFFSICDDDEKNYLEITGIQSDLDVIRNSLSNQYNLSKLEPQIAAVGFDPYGDRILHLEHRSENGAPLGNSADDVMQHINVLLRGPEALDSHVDFKAFKAHLKSYDMRNPEKPILLDTFPIL